MPRLSSKSKHQKFRNATTLTQMESSEGLPATSRAHSQATNDSSLIARIVRPDEAPLERGISTNIEQRMYVDHWLDPILDPSALLDRTRSQTDEQRATPSKESCKAGTRFSPSPFPQLLCNMLNDSEDKGFAHIVSWRPHGRAFQVYQRENFERKVMPR